MLVQQPHPVPEPRSPLLPMEEQWLSSATLKLKAEQRTTFTIRKATVSDAADIAHLGISVFSATFGFSMPSADLHAYLDEVYAVPAIEADISDAAKHVFVATAPSGHVLGFVQLTEGTSEPCLSELDSLVELQRLYVNRESHGMGLGKALAQSVEALARSLGYRSIWLGVWEGNFVAQKVYESMGYERVGDHEFRMGRCIQTDWIMCKLL